MVSSSPPSIRRAASPPRLMRPSTLRTTYSHASLRSVAAPSLAHDSTSLAPAMPSATSSAVSSVSSSLAKADGLLLPESFASENNVGTKGMILAPTGAGTNSEAASTQSSAASATGSEMRDVSGPPTTSGGLVVTGEINAVDADGVVDTVPGEAKQALRDHLRQKLSDSTDACAQISRVHFPQGCN